MTPQAGKRQRQSRAPVGCVRLAGAESIDPYPSWANQQPIEAGAGSCPIRLPKRQVTIVRIAETLARRARGVPARTAEPAPVGAQDHDERERDHRQHQPSSAHEVARLESLGAAGLAMFWGALTAGDETEADDELSRVGRVLMPGVATLQHAITIRIMAEASAVAGKP